MSNKATRTADGKLARLPNGKASRGGEDCDCCPPCFYYLIECCTGVRNGVIACAEAFDDVRKIDGFCYEVDTSEELEAVPEGETEVVPGADDYATCEDCVDCEPAPGSCACCYDFDDTLTLYYSATPGDGNPAENSCSCLLEHLSGVEHLSWNGLEFSEDPAPADGNPTTAELNCLGEFSINIWCDAFRSANLQGTAVEGTCTSFGFSDVASGAPCNDTTFTTVIVYAVATLTTCRDPDTLLCIPGTPDDDGYCTDLP